MCGQLDRTIAGGAAGAWSGMSTARPSATARQICDVNQGARGAFCKSIRTAISGFTSIISCGRSVIMHRPPRDDGEAKLQRVVYGLALAFMAILGPIIS